MKGENKNCNAVDDGDIKIDVMTTIKKIWDLRKTLIKIGIITFVISCVIVLLIPKKYSTMVTLAPEAGQNGEGMLSGVASMLGMGGLNIGEDADALNVDLYPDIVSSTPFMLDILDTRVKMLDNPQEAQWYPWVRQDTRNTPSTKIMGVMVFVPKCSTRNRFTRNTITSVAVVNRMSAAIRFLPAISTPPIFLHLYYIILSKKTHPLTAPDQGMFS